MTEILAPAPKAVVQALVRRLSQADLLSPLSRQRLDALIQLMDEAGHINNAAAQERLFPPSSPNPAEQSKSDEAFQNYRDTLKATAAELGVVFELRGDARRNTDPTTRRLWFAAEDDAEGRLVKFGWSATQGVTAHPQEQNLLVGSEEPAYLLIYAAQERDEAGALCEALEIEWRALGRRLSLLDYWDTPVGEPPEPTQADHLRRASRVLLLLSPRLIADLRVHNSPLVSLLAGVRCPLHPLAFKAVSDEQLAGTPMQGRRVFRNKKGQAWHEARPRERWAAEAARAVPDGPEPAVCDLPAFLSAFGRGQNDCLDEHYVDQLLTGPGQPEGRPALPFLLEWLRDPEGPPFCAVFGELGTGKTTLTQRLTRELLELAA